MIVRPLHNATPAEFARICDEWSRIGSCQLAARYAREAVRAVRIHHTRFWRQYTARG